MATEQINVRIEGALKLEAEGVLSRIGLTPSDVVRMLYNQIIMRQGLPFEARIVTPPKQKKERDMDKMRAMIKASIERNKETLEILAKR